jgi:hypothetical protein
MVPLRAGRRALFAVFVTIVGITIMFAVLVSAMLMVITVMLDKQHPSRGRTQRLKCDLGRCGAAQG